ncbi:hypothetical protein [uncultured Friedmanniella sp.]|uniref:hypothetical protein n=1 Tax=uncultured Friedmanniella sp. TaxID=335381 RepID=UPI0035CCA7B4
MDNPLQRIYKLKVTLLAVVTAVAGLALLFVAKLAEGNAASSWLRHLPVFELGSTLFITGAFVVAYNYVDGRDKEQREDERIRRLLGESAPAFRDAVVRGFAVNSDDLKRVATPELLDDIATNVLALRLGDRQFAQEIYTQVRDQAIRAPERWYDVDVSVRLSSMDERDAIGVPRFSVSVQWEYTVTPSHPVQRFACVSDRDEFHELVTDVPATSTWLMTPRPGFDASQREAFELLQFSVDGEARPIRRSAKKSGQVYSASIGEDVVRAGKPVRIRHLYRVITPQSGHRLFFELTQPTRDMTLQVDYTQTAISHLSVGDLVSTTQQSRISQLPSELDAKVIDIELPGWLLPKAGLTFVWTLASEERLPRAADGPMPVAPTTRTA